MKSILVNRLNYLHTRLSADFGDTDEQTVWLGTSAPWTKISVLQSHSRPANHALSGLLTLPTGTILLFVKKERWPAISLDDCFFLGPADPGDADAPAAATLLAKYRVTTNPASPVLDWYRVEAESH